MTRYLVTGAAGFIGSNLVEALVNRGDEVVGVDNFLSGKRENIGSIQKTFNFIEGDIRDKNVMKLACRGIDYVLHQAALASVPWSMEEPLLAHDHNVTGTLSVLLAARDAGAKKVVLASTSAAYGDAEVLPSQEGMAPQPLSPYAVTKVISETYMSMFNRVFGLPTVSLRYFNVFGKRQDPTSAYAAAIPIFVKNVLADTDPVIFGDGEQTRDFVFIEDVVEANLKACQAPVEADGGVFNIGTGRRVTINAICQKIISLLDKDVSPKRTSERAGDIKHSVADIGKAKKLLNFSPKYDVMSGLEKAIDWYKENLK